MNSSADTFFSDDNKTNHHHRYHQHDDDDEDNNNHYHHHHHYYHHISNNNNNDNNNISNNNNNTNNINKTLLMNTSSGCFCKRPTNPSMAFNSLKRLTFSGVMAHFQMAPVAAESNSLFSVFRSRFTNGSRPRYSRTKSRVSASTAH